MTSAIPRWLPWSYILRAIAAIILGIAMFVFPLAGLASFVLLFGIFSIADGVLALVAAFAPPHGGKIDWSMLLHALVSLAIGAMFLLLPGLSLAAFVLAVAAWMLVIGIAVLVSSASWRKGMPRPWVPLLLAVFSILFGGYLFLFPLAGVAAIPFALGVYALLWGVLMLGIGYELLNRRGRSPEPI
ncbi:HdeD family acid-resistance protein [Sphingosinicella sp. LY1275]|uniref:HdeD family acid-resistance protein n=1 Tax=Sphingosinicella sp. LY1275 TaxID=3095379 RepID=UPI002ADEC88E|nr:DUF308 domain-containing protein [Sphingosinicella sp. LY1275]MEA1013223.1 DUF308 domain-containing protein [Sphingosinicella sp. LY1275]